MNCLLLANVDLELLKEALSSDGHGGWGKAWLHSQGG